MSRESTSLNLSRKDQREMSEFLTQELIYDYYFNSLDKATKDLLEKKIENDRELQTEVSRLKIADQYLQQLKKVRIKPQYEDELKTYESFMQSVERKVRSTRVPAGLKWALEGTLGISVIILILYFLPFNKLSNFRWSFEGPAILAQVDKGESQPLNEDTVSSQRVIAENDDVEKVKDPTVQKIEETSEPFSFKDEDDAVAKKPALPEKVVAQATATAPVEKPVAKEPVVDATAAPARGMLYRGNISVVNAQSASDKITEFIEQLGGRRAGEVEIGWSKSEGSYYYHFTIPEAKYAEMEAFIMKYGEFKVSEEKHPRKIPANLRRYIFTLSEKKQ